MIALENAMYPIIRSGLAKFDVSLPEELQNYVSYLLDESAKLHLRKQVLQPPRALEELREAMDEDELKTFLTIHIREGAWQVVLLFTDELPKYKLPWDWCRIIHNEDEDEDENKEVSNEVIYSSTSGILKAWPTKYDPSLATLCNAITNKDWKVTRLILSMSRTPDEGLKNLSTALTQSELYSLTLHDIGLQSQGLEHLCNALTSVNCRLTNLNVRNNQLGDLGDVGIMHLCDALTSVDCTLPSLNVSSNQLGDNGLKHLCDALTSRNCALTKLKVRFNSLGDRGIKELSEVLTSGFCALTSLDVSGNEFGDVGIKHLCRALTDTKCKLQSLNLCSNRYVNRYVTEDGKKYLSQMLTGTDWEDKGALRLSRSTTK
nr:NACHT, LRR and PYD domains-containing protein 3-like [Pocillopora verrucosa]